MFCGGYCLTASVLRVPSHYTTIQEGINAAKFSDTVLVERGVYFENIFFRNKNIIVASNYIITGNEQDIQQTIIDGSKPKHPDSASCVMFYSSGSDTLAVLEGFTLTHGTGAYTIYPPDLRVKEGGGILLDKSKATIKHNLIVNNNVAYWGGGGIASFLGNPKICSNVIANNIAGYAGGIVLNLSDAVIKNNIIYHNIQNEKTWLTAGIMVWESPGIPVIENNTILCNIACTTFGGISVRKSKPIIRNNVIWKNKQASGKQIQVTATSTITYNNIEDQISGEGNITKFPYLKDGTFELSSESPCIDAGHPALVYNDNGNEIAAFPSLGTTRNDIGAFGGPGARLITSLNISDIITSSKIDFGNIEVGKSMKKGIEVQNLGTHSLIIDSIIIKNIACELVKGQNLTKIMSLMNDSIEVSWTPMVSGKLCDTLYIYHNGIGIENPKKVVITGNALNSTSISDYVINTSGFLTVMPNPIKDQGVVEYFVPEKSTIQISIKDINGKEIRDILKGNFNEGRYELILNRENLLAGVYVLVYSSRSFTINEKVVFSK